MWKPPSAAGTDSTPGPSVRPSACSRNACSTASMQSRSESSSSTSARDSTRIDEGALDVISTLPRGGCVEPLEQRQALRQHLVVIGRRGQERPDRHVDAPGLLVRVLALPKIRLWNALRERGRGGVCGGGSLGGG